jgi:hypothetical protein
MQIKAYSSSPTGQGAYVIEQKARVAARERAENERAQKRLDMDAHINVNASKWRYPSLRE